MPNQIGPIAINRIVLCSADARPESQRTEPRQADDFFPYGRWVGRVRNASNALGCRFVILTTGYGLVNPDDELKPYDKHIDTHPAHVTEKWMQTIPVLLADKGYELLVFYAGGCPRDKYLGVAKPIFHSIGLSVLTFGRPNMRDAGKLEPIVSAAVAGTTFVNLSALLNYPGRLEYYPAHQ